MNTIIHTPTGNLSDSLNFYKNLGFKKIEHQSQHLITDGKVLIEINDHKFARAGIKIYKTDWSSEIMQLEKITKVRKTEEGFLISDPSNVWIYLVEGKHESTFAQAESSFSALGNYAGVSLETMDIKQSMKLWSFLGFKHTSGALDKGWIEFKNDEGFGVSFMNPDCCPHMFFNPSMTYFNGGNNLPVIAKIREADIPITQEITCFNKEGIVDNVIIRDPGGYGFFIFND